MHLAQGCAAVGCERCHASIRVTGGAVAAAHPKRAKLPSLHVIRSAIPEQADAPRRRASQPAGKSPIVRLSIWRRPSLAPRYLLAGLRRASPAAMPELALAPLRSDDGRRPGMRRLGAEPTGSPIAEAGSMIPLQITFQNIARSDALEARVRDACRSTRATLPGHHGLSSRRRDPAQERRQAARTRSRSPWSSMCLARSSSAVASRCRARPRTGSAMSWSRCSMRSSDRSRTMRSVRRGETKARSADQLEIGPHCPPLSRPGVRVRRGWRQSRPALHAGRAPGARSSRSLRSAWTWSARAPCRTGRWARRRARFAAWASSSG